jgi:hypothetical protein
MILAGYTAKDEYLGPKVSGLITDFFDATAWIWEYTQPQMWNELKGIVKAVDHYNFTMAHAIYMNSCYEIVAWCSSIVSKQEDGTIIHTRNLDYGFEDIMRNISYIGTFVKDGKVLFKTVMFGGLPGVFTGMRPGAFSMSIDTRRFNRNPLGIFENMFMLFAGYEQAGTLFRNTLTDCADFDCAYNYLKNKPISGFVYYILAGTKDDEGVVIARKRFGEAHEDRLDTANGKWFLVQTNSDEWKQPGHQKGCTDRCAAAETRMLALGRANLNLTSQEQKVHLTFPVLNVHTLFNTQFIPAQSYMVTTPMDYNPTAEDLAGPYKDDQPPDIREVLQPIYEWYSMFRPLVDGLLFASKMMQMNPY